MKNNKQILSITDAALNRVKFLMKKTENDIVGIRAVSYTHLTLR